MVKVELVQENDQPGVSQEPRITEEVSDGEDAFDDDVEADDYDVNESIVERLSALRDIVPPNYRDGFVSSIGSAQSWVQSALRFGGKSLWVITSSTMLLGVPLSLCILSEQQLTEMEKGMGITDSNDLLAGGEQAFAAGGAK